MWLLAAGCAEPTAGDDDGGNDTAADTIARVATGAVTGTDLFVATVYEEAKAITYVCGGDATFATHTRWFAATPTDDDRIEHTLDGWRVAGQFDADGSRGVLTDPDGNETAYTTDAVGDSIAGLYSVEVGGCTAGVVVVDQGEGAVAQGTYFCPNDAAAAVQVIILSPVTLAPNGGIEVTVELPDGPQMLTVMPQ